MGNKKLVKEPGKILKYSSEKSADDSVIILGPDRTKRSKLRVYACGGRIGRIRTGAGDSELLDEKYVQYLTDPEEAKALKEMLTTGDKSSRISKEKYLELAVKAAKARFKKKNQTYGERRIQTQIVEKSMKDKNGWCSIDMEFRVTPRDGASKHSQVDMVVYDEEAGFGLIELKYNNENCENLEEHCNSYREMCSGAKLCQMIESELIRRAGYLAEYGLIDSRYYDGMKKAVEESGSTGLWYGCLFVNGGKSEARKLVEQIDKAGKDDRCRFLYTEEKDIGNIDLSYNKMQNYEKFMES